MLLYVVFGGMLATTWVQIIKAVLLMIGIIVMSLFVLDRGRLEPDRPLQRGGREQGEAATFSLGPGTFPSTPIDTMSLGLALVLGTAGLPHILMRFFTVPDAKAARGSSSTRSFMIGAFYILTTFIGFGARAVIGEEGVEEPARAATSPRRTSRRSSAAARHRRRRRFLAIIAAVAFATILAVVAGLVLSASGAVAHDIWSNIIRPAKDSEHEEVWAGRDRRRHIGAIAIAIAIIGGEGLNVSFMVGLRSRWRRAPTSRRCCSR